MSHRLLVILSVIVALQPLPLAAFMVVDDSGQQIQLQSPATRIITLAPHIVEQLYAIGAGDRIVGTVSYSDYPPAAKAIPLIGGYNRFDMEAILALKPDLVIGWLSGNSIEQIEQLRGLELPLFLDNPRRVEDIASNMERLGELTGQQEKATEVAQDFRAGFERLRNQYQVKQKVTLFYQLWHQPLMTINGEQIINDIIDQCGGKNIFRELTALTPVVSREAVIAADPEIIITSGMKDARPESHDEWLVWSSLRAVKGEHIYSINPDIIHRASPRILQGAEAICGFIDSAR